MTKIINIKDVKLNDYISFQEHNHIVFEDQLDCSNLYGKVIEIKTLNIIEGKTSISIKVQLDSMKYKEILEEYDNCLYFNFPHDEDYYDNTKVVIIKPIKWEELEDDHVFVSVVKKENQNKSKLKTFKFTRTQTVVDCQTIEALTEDEAESKLELENWKDEEIHLSEFDCEEL
jgi:hypothetical protein